MYRNQRGPTRQVPAQEILAKVEQCIEIINARRLDQLEKAISRKLFTVNTGFLRRRGWKPLIDLEEARLLVHKPGWGAGSTAGACACIAEYDMDILRNLQTLCKSFDQHDLITLDMDTALVINRWMTFQND